jgi:hypothetical protein
MQESRTVLLAFSWKELGKKQQIKKYKTLKINYLHTKKTNTKPLYSPSAE